MPENPPSSAGSRRPSSRRLRALVVAAAVLIAAVWLARFLYHFWHYESTDDAYVAGHIHQVAAQLDGQVEAVPARENATVAAGQLLVRLDPLPGAIARERALAGLARARAEAAGADAAALQAAAKRKAAEADYAQAAAAAAQARAQLDLTRLTLERDRRMSSGEAAVTPADLDAARAAEDEAQAALAAAQANTEAKLAAIAAAKSDETAAADGRQSAQADTAAAQAGLRDAERRLSYAEIRAPAAGRIGAKNVEVGNRVQTGQTLLVLVEPETWVEANFKETQLARMRVGQPAAVTIDAIPGRTFSGRVESVAPASGSEFALLPADNATGNFTKVVQRVPVRIALDPASLGDAASRLAPGLSAVVDVRVR